MNWTLFAAIGGPFFTAMLGLVGMVITARKSHHAAMAVANAAKDQANAAATQAQAALESARASTRVAESTAAAAIQDAITNANEANDKHWAIYLDAMQRRCEILEADINRHSARLEAAELKSEAAEVRANKSEHLYSIAIIYMRRVIRWINENLGVEDYPQPPAELNMDL
jgi:hypothetical protein